MNDRDFSRRVRIRGVYATALTKLLLDDGFQIVQASIAIEERFNLNKKLSLYDLDIYDRPDQQGVHVVGTMRVIETFVAGLRLRLEDVIFRRWDVSINGVYKGVVTQVDLERGFALVNIGLAVGWIGIKKNQNVESGDVLVQVQLGNFGAKHPRLSTNITIPGKYVVLTSKPRIKISRRIREHTARVRLSMLGRELKSNWGIIWRTAAKSQPSDVLRREVSDLAEKGQAMTEKAEHVTAPASIWEDRYFMDVEFPAVSKKFLDKIRRTVMPTIDNHHFYKICGGRIGSAVDLAEQLLERGRPPLEVAALFKREVEAEFPTKGSTIKIDHVKPDGTLLHLGKAYIIAFNPRVFSIQYYRTLKQGGTYDGLETPKALGDYAITDATIGGWYLRTQYFSKDNQFKGMFINVNTPLELYPWGIRYVDLDVDIIVQPNGTVEVIDECELEKSVEDGYITQELAKKARTTVNELLADLRKEEKQFKKIGERI